MQIRNDPKIENHSRESFLAIAKQMSPALRRLLLSDILIRFCERLPYAWIVIYAMDYVGVDAVDIGLLTGVEMITAMACTIPAAYFADKYKREPFIITTFLFFTLFPVALFFARTFALLVVAFAVRASRNLENRRAKHSLLVLVRPRCVGG